MASALSGATVLLAAGGTGGHLQPALAVAAEAEARGARVVVVTTPSQVERVRERYTTYALELKGFERRVDVRAYARTFKLLGAAVPHVRRILKEARPDVAVGGGGFASGPVVAVAAMSGVPGLALEADAHLGVANRLLRPFVKRFCLSFPIEGLEPPRYVVTGRPLAPAQISATPEEGREAFGLSADLPVVLAFGGSQGAQSINRAVRGRVRRQGRLEFQLVHVCGPTNEEQVRADLEALGERFERYTLVPYTDRLAAAMAAADLVVARSGGSSPSSPPSASRPSWCRIRSPPPTTSARTRARWSPAGRRSSWTTPSSTVRCCSASSPRPSATRTVWRPWPRRPPRSAGRTRRSGSQTRSRPY